MRVMTEIGIEYHAETEEFTETLRSKVERRLHRLAGGHRDISGASIAVSPISGANRHAEYRARIVVYHKLGNVAAVRVADTVSHPVLEAMDAVERQVREQRDRNREKSRSRRQDAIR